VSGCRQAFGTRGCCFGNSARATTQAAISPCEALFIRSAGRPVEAIALNAGVGAGGDFVRETALDADLSVIDLNIKSTVHLAKLVLKDVVDRGRGRALFTSLSAATTPGTFNPVYNASKAFVQSFAQAVRNELKDTGVTITALMPGATETNFFTRADGGYRAGMSDKDDPAEVAKTGFEALMAGKDHVVAGSFKIRYRPQWPRAAG